MKSFKINKSTESEVRILGMALIPFLVTAIVALLCILFLVMAFSFLNFLVALAVIVTAVVVTNLLYERKAVEKLFDQQLPDRIINDVY